MTRVRFSHDDRFLVSAGGNDKTIIIWRTDLVSEDSLGQCEAEEDLTEYETQLKNRETDKFGYELK